MNHRTRTAMALASILLIASVAIAQQGYYVLDGFGGVHAGGGAPAAVPATPYFGFDVAVDIEYMPSNQSFNGAAGIVVLDNTGGVHVGGALAANPPGPATPPFGFDIARAVVYRDRRPLIFSASVQFDGTLIGGPTEGIVSVTHESLGIYLRRSA